MREKRGLTYGVYSYLVPKDHAAVYMGSVASANDRIAEAMDVIRAECLSLLRDEYSFYADQGGGGHGGAHARVISKGEWSDVQLYAGCRKHARHCALCPRTAALIAAQPAFNSVVHSSHFISRLSIVAGTRTPVFARALKDQRSRPA